MTRTDMPAGGSTAEAFSLAGKVALVTGAAAGLGAHFAQVLALAGARVALSGRREARLHALAETLRAGGSSVQVVPMDVRRSEQVVRGIESVARSWGGVDVLVNNSGVASDRMAIDLPESDWDAILETNLKGAFLVARECAKTMREGARGGCIVNIASILALREQPGTSAYAASKAALLQLTRVMALELARYQVRVNAIAPGYFATDMSRAFLASPAGGEMLKRIPQRRFGVPEDLDGALLLLSSDAGRYITGTVIAVDGGHLLASL
jgi:NAD(P)-dependent dehydrogenase (short-subunit alcohol dehydrogenase family)